MKTKNLFFLIMGILLIANFVFVSSIENVSLNGGDFFEGMLPGGELGDEDFFGPDWEIEAGSVDGDVFSSRIVVGKKVHWIKEFDENKLEAKVPDYAKDVKIIKEDEVSGLFEEIEDSYEEKIYIEEKKSVFGFFRFFSKLFSVEKSEEEFNESDRIISIDESARGAVVEYYTEAPKMEVGGVEGKRNIVVSAPDELGYEDVLAYYELDYEVEESAINLYHVDSGKKVKFNSYDSDGDGLIDYIDWIVPHLSNQTYELSFVVLNPLEYLRDGDTWNVYFDSEGVGNLTITSPNAEWEEIPEDVGDIEEMKFLDLKCGRNSLIDDLFIIDSGGSLIKYSEAEGMKPYGFFIEGYTCSNTGEFSNLMNIAGYAILDFVFAGDHETIRDQAVDPVPTTNSIVLTATSTDNLTSDNLTVAINTVDSDGDPITNITDWMVDGTSIAVVNLPFDSNVSSLSAYGVKDYSTYSNDVRLGTGISGYAPVWNDACLVGGCYDFDGHDDRIAVMDDDDLTSEEAFTLSTWIYYTGGEQFDTIMLKGSEYWMRLTDYGLGTLNLTTYIYLNGIWAGVVYGPEPLEDEWIQVVCTWDNSTGYLKLYVNGEVTYSAPSLSGAVTNGAGNLLIGGNGGTGAWNGSVDETKVYHRALSPEQIALEYQAGLAGEQVETIVSQETSDGEHWQVVVTPNDGEDGISGLSNSLLVGGPGNELPVIEDVNLNATSGYNVTFDNLSVSFSGVSDLDGDAITNITDWRIDGTSVAVLNMPFDSNTNLSTGGDVAIVDGYVIHTFTSDDTFVVPENKTVDVLVVGGGGGGGGTGSGGGAGGYIYESNYQIRSGSYSVVVGGGGAGGIGATAAATGEDSIFNSLIAKGGGGGITHGSSINGVPGGSGSGSPVRDSEPAYIGGFPIGGQGNKGGDGYVDGSWVGCCGGGGGAGTVGLDGGNTASSCHGGNGTQNSLSGTSIYYAGGGGGGEVHGDYFGYGGLGGGGNASMNSVGTAGINGTGGGGGGGAYNWPTYYDGGAGGSGTVIIKYPFIVEDYSTYENNGTVGDGTAASVPTWTSEGKIGGAYDFDSSDDSIYLTGLDVNTSTGSKTTVETWMYWEGGSTEMLFGFTSYDLILGYGGCIGFNTGAGDSWGVSTPANLDNEWHHIIAIFTDTGSMSNKIYIDGVEQTLSQCQGTTADRGVGTTARISGWTNDNNYKFGGLLDEFKIYDRALSPEQIVLNYQEGLANHSIETIVSQETTLGDNWTVAVTPNDATEDGTTVLSNPLVIDEYPCNAPESGDWIIDGIEYCEDMDITMAGHITMDSGDKLYLNNVSLGIDQDVSWNYDFTVGDGAELYTYGGTTIDSLNSLYTYLFVYGYVEMNDTTTNNRVRHYHQSGGSSEEKLNNVSVGELMYMVDDSNVLVAEDSYINVIYNYLEGGTNFYNVSNLVEDVPMNISIVAEGPSTFTTNFTNTEVNNFYIWNNGADVNVTNSTFTYYFHYNYNNDDSYLKDVDLSYLVYSSIQSGVDAVVWDNWTYPMDGLTRDIVTSGNNVFSLDNVDYNINYMYTYYDMNITNSDIYFNPDYSNGVNYWENSTIYRIDANVGTNSTFKNTTIDSSTYSRLFPTSTLNFEPGSDNNRIDKLYVINAGTRTITGYVSFTDLYTAWTAGNYINRYFPINLTNIIGEGVSDIDVLIKDSVGADVNSGTSGATGIANINVTDDENATYQIYIGGEWMVNFSMLGSTAPYGIQVDVIKPVIDYAKILPDPFYTDDGLVTWVNCSDGFYDPLGVYWKVYNNSVEFPSENGQENVSSGTNTNLYNISSSLTEKGENWTVEFTCSNWVVNSTAVNASVVIQNTVPETYTSVILNSSLGTNLTSENLSVSFSGASDLDSDSLTNITDWRIDGSSVAVLNMPFDSNRSGQSGAVVRDYSSYENNGTLAGTSTDPTWSSDCQVGGCYDFDDDYLSVSDEIELRLHNFTLSAWIKFNQLSTGSWFGIVGKGSRFASRNYAFFQAPSTNQIFYSFSNGTVFASHYSNKTDFSVDTWYYVVTTYNGSSFNLYVDGDLDSNYSESRTPITTSDDFFIGGISTYTGFNGSIDEVQVYNFALSKNQIKEIYDAGVAGHQVETFVSQETNGGDNWTVTVTPNDGEVDGTTVLSNWLEILAGDTCTYSGSGSWAVDCSDACNVTSTVDLSGNDISITGVGTFSTTANITNYGTLHLEGDSETEICHVICQGGCFVN